MTLRELKAKLNSISNYYNNLPVTFYDEFHFESDVIEDVEIGNGTIRLINRSYNDGENSINIPE